MTIHLLVCIRCGIGREFLLLLRVIIAIPLGKKKWFLTHSEGQYWGHRSRSFRSKKVKQLFLVVGITLQLKYLKNDICGMHHN